MTFKLRKPMQKTEGAAAPPTYTLAYLQTFEGKAAGREAGAKRLYHDISLKKWRLIVRLREDDCWYLSVFIHEDGTFDKFSLDEESACDSHYEFKDEAAVRRRLRRPGDEHLYLDEILTRCAKESGGGGVLSAVWPYITAQFHYY